MNKRDQTKRRRKLSLKSETLRALSLVDLGGVVGGSWWGTEDCQGDTRETDGCNTGECDTNYCGMSGASRFC